ncbi:MAG: GFA family protein [Rhodospirillales bacterium]|nr:GFA family protein [Rhodospirillales bacterium]MBO6788691.1 GFA family protein [Rhodospirillales bacterium]
MADQPVTGSCLCGGVKFRVSEFQRPVVACHCTQCRKTTGHYGAATTARNVDLQLDSDETLSWYSSSDVAERGFCNRCGSSLFWRPVGGVNTSIMAGVLDAPTGLELVSHIFTEDAGDYYELNDGLPAHKDGGGIL